MEKTSTDYICNLDCPVKLKDNNISYCCQNCKESKKDYVTDANRHLWGNRGFWSVVGCKLSREDMPPECRTYDCRHHAFTITRMWADGKWRDCLVSENSG